MKKHILLGIFIILTVGLVSADDVTEDRVALDEDDVQVKNLELNVVDDRSFLDKVSDFFGHMFTTYIEDHEDTDFTSDSIQPSDTVEICADVLPAHTDYDDGHLVYGHSVFVTSHAIDTDDRDDMGSQADGTSVTLTIGHWDTHCHQFEAPDELGTYDISYSISAREEPDDPDFANTHLGTIDLEVEKAPLNAEIYGDQNLWVGETGSFDAFDTEGSIESYKWTTSDGQSDTGQQAEFSFDSDGTETVSLTVTDEWDREDTDSITVSVSESDQLNAVIDAPQTAEPDETVTISGGSSTGSDIELDWYINGDHEGTGDYIEWTPESSATYNIDLIAQDGLGNEDTDSTTIVVTDNGDGDTDGELNAQMSDVQNPDERESFFIIDQSDGDITERDWDVSGDQVQGEIDGDDIITDDDGDLQFPNGLPEGHYDVTLEVTDEDGNTDATTQEFAVGDPPEPLDLNLGAMAGLGVIVMLMLGLAVTMAG